MIRGSVVIAVIAVVVSLVLHAMGLSVTAPRLTEQPGGTRPSDAVELGNSFEDLVENVTEPVEPEPAEAPEPPVEEEPEPAPEPAEIPTSEVHVASDNPQRTFAPDTGTSEVVRPLEPEPVEPEPAATPDAATEEAEASDDIDETPTAEPSETPETPEGASDAVETVSEAPVPSVEVAEPIQSETVEADIADAGEESEPTERAVTSSLRPRLPDRRPDTEPQGTLSGSRDFSALRFPSREIESPLTTYRRRGVDAFTQSSSGNRSGGRGPGNSDRTNYAGRVLVHLNRAPIVYTSARGFAKVFFEINPDGTLAWVDVIDSSGTAEVERAAKAQVRAASPFPKPPGGVSRKLSFFYNSN